MWRWRRPDPEGLVEGEANSKVPPKLIYPSPARFNFREHVVSKLAKQLARDEPILIVPIRLSREVVIWE